VIGKKHLGTHNLQLSTIREELSLIDQLLTANPQSTNIILDTPAQGLCYFDGFECGHCQKIYSSEKGLLNHFSKSHQGKKLLTKCKFMIINKMKFKVIFYSIFFFFFV